MVGSHVCLCYKRITFSWLEALDPSNDAGLGQELLCVCVRYELQVMFVACVGGAWLGTGPRVRGAVLCMCI